MSDALRSVTIDRSEAAKRLYNWLSNGNMCGFIIYQSTLLRIKYLALVRSFKIYKEEISQLKNKNIFVTIPSPKCAEALIFIALTIST